MCRTGLVALWHVGSSQNRDRIRVPCLGRRILNLPLCHQGSPTYSTCLISKSPQHHHKVGTIILCTATLTLVSAVKVPPHLESVKSFRTRSWSSRAAECRCILTHDFVQLTPHTEEKTGARMGAEAGPSHTASRFSQHLGPPGDIPLTPSTRLELQ